MQNEEKNNSIKLSAIRTGVVTITKQTTTDGGDYVQEITVKLVRLFGFTVAMKISSFPEPELVKENRELMKAKIGVDCLSTSGWYLLPCTPDRTAHLALHSPDFRSLLRNSLKV